MEFFKGLEDGTNYFFTFQAQQLPGVRALFIPWLTVGYVVLGALFLVALALLMVRKNYRAGGWFVVIAALAIMIVEALRVYVVASRPQDAADLLPPGEMFRSFPSRPVFLSTLLLFLLAFALQSVLTKKGAIAGVLILAGLGVVIVAIGQFLLSLAFLTDVVAGLTGGVALAILARHLAFETTPATSPVRE